MEIDEKKIRELQEASEAIGAVTDQMALVAARYYGGLLQAGIHRDLAQVLVTEMNVQFWRAMFTGMRDNKVHKVDLEGGANVSGDVEIS